MACCPLSVRFWSPCLKGWFEISQILNGPAQLARVLGVGSRVEPHRPQACPVGAQHVFLVAVADHGDSGPVKGKIIENELKGNTLSTHSSSWTRANASRISASPRRS